VSGIFGVLRGVSRALFGGICNFNINHEWNLHYKDTLPTLRGGAQIGWHSRASPRGNTTPVEFWGQHHGVAAITNFNASTYLFRYTKHTAINTGVPSIRMVLLVGIKADLGSGNTLRMEDQFRPFGRNERFTPSRTPHGVISIQHEIITALPIMILCIMKLW